MSCICIKTYITVLEYKTSGTVVGAVASQQEDLGFKSNIRLRPLCVE